ncbi:hypothetical protein O6H91_03G033800 [Diphasiastrum complanatum]|uniref:Uncharacterized protein n=1 Tax=Diphasiastrum complanatum TaxID=34168 RepID=A0ACC2E4W1_DIPCM|nr:hypothetical protein O6H91_03G033800 [Diphasiastrum complanatum]
MAYTGGGSISRPGLTSRVPPQNEQLQLRIDPLHGDLDEEIHGLQHKVALLKNIAQDIEVETKYQNDLLNQLEATMLKAQAGLKNTMNRLNRALTQHGSNHVMHVVLFALFCFLVVYLWSKFSK